MVNISGGRKSGERDAEGVTEKDVLLFMCCHLNGIEQQGIQRYLCHKYDKCTDKTTKKPLNRLKENGYLLSKREGRDNIWRPNPKAFNDIADEFLEDKASVEDFILSEYTQRTLKTLPEYRYCMFHFPYLKQFFERGMLISPTFLLYLAAKAPEVHIAMMLLLPSSEEKYSSHTAFCSIEQVRSPEEEVVSIIHDSKTEPLALYVSLLVDYVKYRKLRDDIRLLLNDACMDSLYSNFDLPRPVFESKTEFGKDKTIFHLFQNAKE